MCVDGRHRRHVCWLQDERFILWTSIPATPYGVLLGDGMHMHDIYRRYEAAANALATADNDRRDAAIEWDNSFADTD